MRRNERDLPLSTYLGAYSVTAKPSQLLERIQLYRFIADGLVQPETFVIDVGCGEGFGSLLLSQRAGRVLGIEACEHVVAHAREHYASDRLSFRHADIMEVNDLHERADVVCALDVIEHVRDDAGFLQKLQWLVRRGGHVILSTPNRMVSVLLTGRKYEFHIREYAHSEFVSLLQDNLDGRVRVYCVNPGFMSRLTAWDVFIARLTALTPSRLKDLARTLRFRLTSGRRGRGWKDYIESFFEEESDVAILPQSESSPLEDCSDYLAVIQKP